MISPAQFKRHCRQMAVNDYWLDGQLLLAKARVLIVGVGGIGCSVSQHLVANGLGCVDLMDDDVVTVSNLSRQLLFAEKDVGRFKVIAAAERLGSINSEVEITPYCQRFCDSASVPEQARLTDYDLVLDCSDNFATRVAVNRYCVAAKIPLLSASASGVKAAVVCLSASATQPCYECLFSELQSEQQGCDSAGVIGPLPGLIGAYQASLTLQWLIGMRAHIISRIFLLDIATLSWQAHQIKKDPHCIH